MRYGIGTIAIIIMLLSGCVSLNDSYRNQVGEKRYCRSVGVGVIGVPAAVVMQGSCGSRLKAAGFDRE